jgi:hypothetical protein
MPRLRIGLYLSGGAKVPHRNEYFFGCHLKQYYSLNAEILGTFAQIARSAFDRCLDDLNQEE